MSINQGNVINLKYHLTTTSGHKNCPALVLMTGKQMVSVPLDFSGINCLEPMAFFSWEKFLEN